MFAALTLIVCFLIPGLFATASLAISVSALKRHISYRQLLCSLFIVTSVVSSLVALYQSFLGGENGALMPVLLIGFTFFVSIAQFATAALFGALGRLRQRLA